MEGTSYFSKDNCKAATTPDHDSTNFELGRSGEMGDGPQVYIRIGDEAVIIPRVCESEFFAQVKVLGTYLGHN